MSSEPVIRVAFFLAVFVVVAAWEAMAPRRTHQLPRRARWPANLGIVALNTVLVRLLLPTTAVAFALLGEQRGWGLLHAFDLLLRMCFRQVLELLARPCRCFEYSRAPGSPCRRKRARSII